MRPLRYLLAALCLLATPIAAQAAIAIDANAGAVAYGSATAANIVANGVNKTTTTSSGDTIIACAGAEWVLAAGTNGTVSGVSGGGLTWAKRSSVSGYNGTLSGAFSDFECWWAYAASPVSAMQVNATFTKPGGTFNFDDATIIVFAVAGQTGTAYPTTPWDQNGSLPVAGFSNLLSAPSAVGQSTTNSAGMLINCWGGPSLTSNIQGAGHVPSGFTYITGFYNGGGTNGFGGDCSYLVFSSAQSSVTTTWGANVTGWGDIGDALSTTGGASAAVFHGLTLMGVGK